MAILEALRLFSCSYQSKLAVESDLANVANWASHADSRPSRFQFLFNEIKELSS